MSHAVWNASLGQKVGSHLYRQSRLSHTTVTQHHQFIQRHLSVRHDGRPELLLETWGGGFGGGKLAKAEAGRRTSLSGD